MKKIVTGLIITVLVVGGLVYFNPEQRQLVSSVEKDVSGDLVVQSRCDYYRGDNRVRSVSYPKIVIDTDNRLETVTVTDGRCNKFL